MSSRSALALLPVVFFAALGLYACGSAGGDSDDTTTGGAGGTDAAGAAGEAGAAGMAGGFSGSGGFGGDMGTPLIPDPKTCTEAAQYRTYWGCDFWPTVTDNIVRPDFDFAVVAANTQETEATVTVEKGGQPVGSPVTVPPGGLVKLYLPWVPELKGTTSIAKGCPTDVKVKTVAAKQGAYHVTSDIPIALYQFNALEYAGKGGPAGKSWSTCQSDTCLGQFIGKCFSYTNDASLLLPSTALTGTYRIAGAPAWKASDPQNPNGGFTYPPYFAVTATQDGTLVNVKLSATGAISGGSGLPDIPAGGTTSFKLDRGDVALVVGKQADGVDFSGSLVTSNLPVQVITGIACTNVPKDQVACDHLEETVLPAETLGRRYFVTVPTGPKGPTLGAVVRFYGNVDGTKLEYPGADPGGPKSLQAGEVVEIGPIFQDFEVKGDHEFTVATFQVGAGQGSLDAPGDPAQSIAVAVEQYRLSYVFLAPDDYDTSYVDVVAPDGAFLKLDGGPLQSMGTPLSSGFLLHRVKLGKGVNGAHVLTSNVPIGAQVMGYGAYTSYQYPGGLNLGMIAPPPVK